VDSGFRPKTRRRKIRAEAALEHQKKSPGDETGAQWFHTERLMSRGPERERLKLLQNAIPARSRIDQDRFEQIDSIAPAPDLTCGLHPRR
jgi:hypothetical protein